MPKMPDSPEAMMKRFLDQQRGYTIAMRLVMTLLVAGKEVTVDAAMKLAREELEPSVVITYNELFRSVISDVVAAANRLRGQTHAS